MTDAPARTTSAPTTIIVALLRTANTAGRIVGTPQRAGVRALRTAVLVPRADVDALHNTVLAFRIGVHAIRIDASSQHRHATSQYEHPDAPRRTATL
jgi:hypothetical protein